MTLKERVQARVDALGESPITLAKSVGLERGFINDILIGRKKSIRYDKLPLVAEALKCTQEFLTGEDAGAGTAPAAQPGQPARPTRLRERHGNTVPVVGYVGAASEAHFYAVEPGDLDDAPAPIGATDATVAVEVRGDSLGKMFDRWFAYYDNVRTPVTDDLIGQLCVVWLEDGRTLIKKIKRSKTAGLFDLIAERHDPIRNAKVEAAALVTDLKPRVARY